ncbi:MAG: hypothetical protein LBN10_09455 [Propionibacteriaceae bacterium]|nr:hypothetical protein [Propionibacteriaceae bacterium]
MRAKDTPAVLALRSALAALDNACALPLSEIQKSPVTSEYIAGTTQGLGATETQRQTLTDAEVISILESEVAAHLDEARYLAQANRARQGEAAAYQAQVIQAILER